MMDTPEQVQIGLATNVEIGITGHAAADMGIVFPLSDQPGPHWILENIVQHLREGLLHHFAFTQDMVMGLVRPFRRMKHGAEVFADELDGHALVGVFLQPSQIKCTWSGIST